MNSFYGGKQGRTYNIVARFNSINEMINQFKKGAAYTDVSYGQYVLIDTILNNNNPNNPENGKIYRRGLNYTNEDGGAIYIGQIQGPEGKIPPLDIMQFNDFSTTTSSASTVIDGPSTFSPPTALKAWDGTTYHPIQIGYATIADADGSNRKGIIGLDIPQPVVKLNSSIVSGTTETFNLIKQTDASTNATSNGAQYYAYDIKFPIVSNFEVLRTVDPTTKADPTTYTLSYYSPTSTGTFEQTTMSFPIEVVDKMRWQGDLIQYRTTKNEWKDLYNPNGQFHIYAEINNITSSTTAYPASKAIEDLNSSTQYKYGVRTPMINGTSTQYDITQAGWVLSVELKEEENTPVHSALFAYDYTPDTGSSSYTLETFKTLSPEVESDIKPKGWFKVQDFDSSLASDPEQIILLGKEGEQSSLDVKSKSKTDLKKDGIWAYSQKEEAIKWWI